MQSEFVLIGADTSPRNSPGPGGVKEEIDEGEETHVIIPKLSASPPTPSDPSKRNS